MAHLIGRREFIITSTAAASLSLAESDDPTDAARVSVADLKVDYVECPLGLENQSPHLSWRLRSTRRGVSQSAYRILVASSREKLAIGRADVWDSGCVRSATSVGVVYGGRRLQSRERCWWQVRIWDEAGIASASSEDSWWEMGILNQNEWKGQWLAAEDSIAAGDRRAGLSWIWGESRKQRTTRGFRLKFPLDAESAGGHLYVVANDWSWWTQITRIWVDDEVVGGCGRWLNHLSIPPTASNSSATPWICIKRMEPGEHSIALEVETDERPTDINVTYGVAALMRLRMIDGRIVRLGGGTRWKTSLSPRGNWHVRGYDDGSWQRVVAVAIDYQPWPSRPALHLRREFSIKRVVTRARLYATALGAYQVRLNGNRVGDLMLSPEISCYEKRVLYRVQDVTKLIKKGSNAIGVLVGDGWYGSFDGRFAWGAAPCRVLAQLEIEFVDGTRQIVATGPGWTAKQGPILSSDIRLGEVYDARLELPGWDGPGFDDSDWQKAMVAPAPSCALVAQTGPGIRVSEVLKAIRITEPVSRVYIFDFGQNFAGWCRLHVTGERGTRVELRFGELLKSDGLVDQSYLSIGEPKRDVYILKGDSTEEIFEPHFTYRGFRYVQIDGLSDSPSIGALEGIVVHSDLHLTGQITTDNLLVNTIWRNTLWAQRSNFVGFPTDCPSREQRGWTGDAGAFWDSACFNMDASSFTARHMQNLTDDQRQDGAFSIAVPEPVNNNAIFRTSGGAPGWSDAGVILPWTAWQHYGDISIIEGNWEAMRRYLEWVRQRNPDCLWTSGRGYDYGDLYEEELTHSVTPKTLTATTYWAHSVELLAQMAHAIGRVDEEMELRALFARISNAFNDAFVKPDGTIGNDSQTGYVLSLKFNLLPVALRSPAARHLAKNIRARGVALTTGYLATPFVLDVLSDFGFAELAYGLLLRTEFPSWGYMIAQGATAIWETWSGEESDGSKISKLSQNHFALGAVSGFLFRRVAGIASSSPGFSSIVLRPVVDSRLKHAGGKYESVRGLISTRWERESDSRLTFDVTIPANTTALVHLPAGPHSLISESGRRLSNSRSPVRLVNRSDGEATIAIGSGAYEFLVEGS